jgi:HD-GYP domain-containing protein (c-di-GMP phosphodiesterase class II)
MNLNSEPSNTYDSLRKIASEEGEIKSHNSKFELKLSHDDQDRHHFLLGETGEAIFIADYPSGNLLGANDIACALLECTTADSLKLNLKNILPDDILDNVIYPEFESPITESNVNPPHNTYLLSREGKCYPVELNISQIPSKSTRFIIIIARSLQNKESAERILHELKSVSHAAKIFRNVKTRAEMLPLILEHIFNLFPLKGAALAFRDRISGEMVFEETGGLWKNLNGWRFSSNAEIPAYVYKTGEPFVTKDIDNKTFFFPANGSNSLEIIACIPLMADEQTSGVLWVGAEDNLSEEDIRLLTGISEVAANALYQASLYEQTQRRVQRMAALRSIDMTITASLDLQVTLDILLSQVISHLNVDAATVLLFRNATRTLEYANSIGFRTPNIKQSSLNLGESFAGQAALERRIMHYPTLDNKKLSHQFTHMLKAEHITAYLASPLIAKGEVKGILEIFHRSSLNPDAEWMDFLEALSMQAAIAIDNAELFQNLQRSNLELTMAYDNTLEGWVRTLALRDMETEVHTQRVTMLTLRLASAMGMPDSTLVHVKRGALLHDIGKLAIPDSILKKSESLNEEEWDLLRQHPTCAADLLAPIPYLAPALDIPYCHHEKWDGSGYPRGLKGEEIPLAARIFTVVDVWDALSADRPYREAWPQDKVIEYLCEQSGKHFDPRVVEAFLLMLENSASKTQQSFF